VDNNQEIKLSYDSPNNKTEKNFNWITGNFSGNMEPLPAIVGSGKLSNIFEILDYQTEFLGEINQCHIFNPISVNL